jgi:SpoIID/LytB domain protein
MSRRFSVQLAVGCATAVLAASLSAGVSAPGPATGAELSGLGALSGTGLVAATTCPAPGGAKIAEAATPQAAVKVFGHGWGHGMGMSQYGAQGAARLGCSYRTILGTYYHDSSVVKRALDAPVLLSLAQNSTTARLDAETGTVRWGASSPSRHVVQPMGSTWLVARTILAGRIGLALKDATGTRRLFVPDGGVLSARHAGTVVKVRPTGSTSGLRTRWDSARFIGTGSGIRVSEVIGAGQGYTAVQKYLLGLAEVPVSWPMEALKAQVVAARTYLSSKYSASERAYVLRTTTADQVYRGFNQEEKDTALGGRWRRAVVATSGRVIVDSSGRTIEAMYSSSMGGHTENRQYVYGKYGISYLKAVDDSRWDNASDNPYRRWSKGFSKANLAKRFGFDSVSSWTVPKRGSAARLNGVLITGKKAGKTVTRSFTGTQARGKLGLRSPGFTFGSRPKAAPKPSVTSTPTLAPTPTQVPTQVPTPTPTPTVSASPTATVTAAGGLR